MALLSRDQVLNASDATYRDVEVPEWGGTVRVKSLTGQERDAFEASIVDTRGSSVRTNTANFRAKLVALCAVDEQGARLFTERDVQALGSKAAAALQRIVNVSMELSGLSASDVEELTESFDDAPSEDATSA